MTTINNDRSLVVIQLTGANDPLNTVIPYTDGALSRLPSQRRYPHRPSYPN